MPLSEGKYLIEIEGKLANDWDNDRHLSNCKIEAKLIEEYSKFKLINDGPAKFLFSDGKSKTYNYKNGEIIID